MYLLALKNKLNSNQTEVQSTVTYNTKVRILKETKGNCTLNNIINSNYYQYLCEIHEDTSNIKSISLKPEFKFFPQNNINIVGISPLAYMLMNNLLLCDERYDILSNATIYLMDNSAFELYDQSLFNITGIINGTQPKLENKNLSLMSNFISEKPKLQTEIDCVINNISTDKYILNCKRNRTLEIDLQYSISFIDDSRILLQIFLRVLSLIQKTMHLIINYLSIKKHGLMQVFYLRLLFLFLLFWLLQYSWFITSEKRIKKN